MQARQVHPVLSCLPAQPPPRVPGATPLLHANPSLQLPEILPPTLPPSTTSSATPPVGQGFQRTSILTPRLPPPSGQQQVQKLTLPQPLFITKSVPPEEAHIRVVLHERELGTLPLGPLTSPLAHFRSKLEEHFVLPPDWKYACRGIDVPQAFESLILLRDCLIGGTCVLNAGPDKHGPSAVDGLGTCDQPPMFVGQPTEIKTDCSSAGDQEWVGTGEREEADGPMEVYVGNLAPSVTRETLLELLRQAGPVDVHIPRDANGLHRGFAFGQMESQRTASYAITLLDGISLGGRPLRMRLAHG